MKRGWGIALVLAGCLMAVPALCAQDLGDSGTKQSKADKKAKKAAEQAPQQTPPPAAPKPADPNAFPTDTSDVPVLPSKESGASMGTFSDTDSAAASLPGDDQDPMRSPDQTASDSSGSVEELGSSSSVKGLDSLLPGADDPDTGRRKRKSDVLDGPPKETAKDNVSVGKYYLDKKNWKAAQSRFQSALVLAPEDPEVYWGLAESARHLGNFADARANYEKVIEYDPDSKHAKEAKKILKDPEMAGK
jgi:tetratricopeptide (TPR) repeat protein